MEQPVDELDVWDEKTEQRGHPVENLISVSIIEDPSKVMKIGLNLWEEDR